MAELMAEVFAARGHQGLVVHGGDGLDELTTTTCSTLWAYADGELRRTELDPTDLGLPRAWLSWWAAIRRTTRRWSATWWPACGAGPRTSCC